MTRTYLIALGSNLTRENGDSPKKNVLSAMDSLDALAPSGVVRSALYQTAPVPISDQPWYTNAVVALDSDLEPLSLLTELQAIEGRYGRVRTVQNAARELDLDIIALGGEVIETDSLTVPHPRMHLRGFVLYPLAEVAPNWVHPTLNKTVHELIQALPNSEKATLAGRVA